MNPSRNVSEGDLVLLKEQSSRNTWPIAFVHKALPDEDGLVRRVTLRLKPNRAGKTQYRERAIHDLILLIPHSAGGSVVSEHERKFRGGGPSPSKS